MKCLKYFAEGKYYNEKPALDKSYKQASYHIQKFETNPPPMRNSQSVQAMVQETKQQNKEKLHKLVPVNSTSKMILEKHHSNTVTDDINRNNHNKPKINGSNARLLKNSLFIGKGDFEMNRDVLHKTDIRNSQALSREGPEWTLRTMAWYKPEHFDPAAKALRLNHKGNTDIFGNPPNEQPKKLRKNEKQFISTPAVPGQKKDATRQFLMDTKYGEFHRSVKKWTKNTSHLNFDWPEQKKKQQTYDKFVVPKIGSEEYRSRISRKREAESKVLDNIKLYEPDISLKTKLKPIEIKLGASWNPDNVIMLS